MTISLECSECKQMAEYDPEEMLGEAIKIYRKSGTRPNLPNFIVIQCKLCPRSFKVSKQQLLKTKALKTLLGEYTDGYRTN